MQIGAISEVCSLPRLSRRRASILLELVHMLRELEDSDDDAPILQNIQERLIELMCRGEARVRAEKDNNRRLRSQLHIGRLEKGAAQQIRAAISVSDDRIVDHQYWLYVLRCVGDAIAHIYLPSLALRHCSRGSPVGFISLKKGTRLERRLWRTVFRRTKAAAILCDLTNCLRIGDICFLTPEGTYEFAEVKQPGHVGNARTHRQSERASIVMEYLATDRSDRIIPGQTLTAFEGTVARASHVDAVSELFARARSEGAAWCDPEEGLRYVIRDVESAGSVEACIPKTTGPAKPIAWYVTATSEIWPHVTPYMLSLRAPLDAVEFAGGRFSLTVFMSTDHVIKYCGTRGYKATFSSDDSSGYMLELQADHGDMVMRLSSFFLSQCAINLESLRSLIDQAIERADSSIGSEERRAQIIS